MSARITEIKNCRACGKELPADNLISLGNQTIVDFVKEGQLDRGKAPLDLVLCRACGLLQLRHTVDPDLLYRRFWYRSGINEQMRDALQDVVKQAIKAVGRITELDYVCDIGSNDGTMLSLYPCGHRVGFEPAEALAVEAAEKDKKARFVANYFNAPEALLATGGRKFSIITAIAMFYDLDNPGKFLWDVRDCLANDGVFVVQMNYLPQMLRNLSFDNIGHEHLCYYSLTTLKKMFREHGLEITQAEINGVNGGSIRVFARKMRYDNTDIGPEVADLLNQERETMTLERYKMFAERIQTTSRMLRDFLYNLKRLDKRVYAYGASTRGSTLLQTILEGEDARDLLVAAAERDVNKWGLQMAGLGLPIVSEEEAREQADYFLLLPYHFSESIFKRERQWMAGGGRFILPIPFPRVISLEDVGGGEFICSAQELIQDLKTLV